MIKTIIRSMLALWVVSFSHAGIVVNLQFIANPNLTPARALNVNTSSARTYDWSDSSVLFNGPVTAGQRIHGGFTATYVEGAGTDLGAPNLEVSNTGSLLRFDCPNNAADSGGNSMAARVITFWDSANFLTPNTVFDGSSGSSFSVSTVQNLNGLGMRFVIRDGSTYFVSNQAGGDTSAGAGYNNVDFSISGSDAGLQWGSFNPADFASYDSSAADLGLGVAFSTVAAFNNVTGVGLMSEVSRGTGRDVNFQIDQFRVDLVNSPRSAPPNILFIAIDDLRPDLNCYEETAAEQMGGPSARLPIHSPFMDSIASEGMVFERAYCQVPLCGPSRVSIMTGTYPDRTEIYGMAAVYGGNWRTYVPDGATIVSLPQQFRTHGYYAASYGKIYDSRLGLDVGISWDEESTTYRGYIDAQNGANRAVVEAADVADNQYTDGITAEKALNFLATHDTNTPFFLAVGFAKPHLPFNAPKSYWDLYDPATLPLGAPTNPPVGLSTYTLLRPYKELETYTQPVTDGEGNTTYLPITQPTPESLTRHLVHGYLACISYVDAQIGKIIDNLKVRGLYDNTIIVIWGDHGFKLADFGEWAKATTLEIDSRVPLIIRLPVSMAADRNAHSYSMVELVDVLPTVCEAAGLPIPNTAQGRSLVPILKNASTSVRQTALTQYRASPGMAYSVRSAQWRYTEFRTLAGSLVERQLFDLSSIPHVETVNVADSESYFRDALSALIFDYSPTTGGSVEDPVPAMVRGTGVSGSRFLVDFTGNGAYSVWKSRGLAPLLFTGPTHRGVRPGTNVVLDAEMSEPAAFYKILPDGVTP